MTDGDRPVTAPHPDRGAPDPTLPPLPLPSPLGESGLRAGAYMPVTQSTHDLCPAEKKNRQNLVMVLRAIQLYSDCSRYEV